MKGETAMQASANLRGVLVPAGNQKGMALALALLAIAFLSLLGAAFLGISLNESTIATHSIDSSKAFDIAEAGIEHARRELMTANVNAILASTPSSITFTSGGQKVAFGGGTYTVQIANNTPTDPSATIDTDNRLFLTSTGTYRNATRRVRALVEIPPFSPPPGSLSLYDPTQVKVKGKSEVNGNNFDPPALPCTGSGCDGTASPSVPAIPGIFLNNATSVVKDKAPAQVFGSPAIKTDTASTPTTFEKLADILAPSADITLSGDGDFPTDCGTQTAPKIIVINSGERKVKLGGNAGCVGILIVRAPDTTKKTKFKVEGTFQFQGLIIVTGFAKIEFKGTSDVYGAVVGMGPIPEESDDDDEDKDTKPAKLKVTGNSKIRYSQIALDRAKGRVETKVLTWQELTTN